MKCQVVSTPLMVPLAVQLHWTDVARMAVHIHCVHHIMSHDFFLPELAQILSVIKKVSLSRPREVKGPSKILSHVI